MSDKDVDEAKSANRENKPFRAEYAASSRAKCKKCEENIEKDSLKMAFMVKSRFHDGHDAKYHHLKCFYQIKRPKTIAEIGNYEKLKFEDQKLLEKAIETNGASILGPGQHAVPEEKVSAKRASKISKESGKSKKREAKDTTDGTNYSDYMVELAKSNRSTCNSCHEKIAKSLVRIGKLNFDVDMDAVYAANGPTYKWHHLECFGKHCSELDFYGDPKLIPGFENLEKEDQKSIRNIVKPVKKENGVENGESLQKKTKLSDEETKKIADEEKKLKRQSDKYYALREIVSAMKKNDIAEMMQHMNQKSDYKNRLLLVEMATDVMLFGPLEPCPKCKGQLILKSSAYICIGGSEEDPCTYETRDPNRGAPDVPGELVEKYPYFADEYIFKPRKRLFPSKLVDAIKTKEAELSKTPADNGPLRGLKIGVSSWKFILTDQSKVEARIISLGAQLQTAIEKNIFFLVTTQEEVAKKGPKLEVASALDIPFVTAKCLFDIKDESNVCDAIKDNLVESYELDLQKRYNEFIANGNKQ